MGSTITKVPIAELDTEPCIMKVVFELTSTDAHLLYQIGNFNREHALILGSHCPSIPINNIQTFLYKIYTALRDA